MKILYGQELVNYLRKECDKMTKRLWICTPYLGEKVAVSKIIGNRWQLNSKINFKLLVDNSDIRNCDYRTLKFFQESNVEIKSLKALHAKIYIFDQECLVTSANLTRTAFTSRYEIGVQFNKKESQDIISLFNFYWQSGILLKKITAKMIAKQRSMKKGFRGNVGKSGLSKMFDLPEEGFKEYAAWLKISGFSKGKKRKAKFYTSSVINESFIGTPKRPGLKKNEIVILSRMGSHNGKFDHHIYGRAKVGIAFRDKKDNLKKYKKRVDSNKEMVYKNINRWPYGFWIKELELIKGESQDFIWLSDLTDEKNDPVIKKQSLIRHSHIKLSLEQLSVINEKLEGYFESKGKLNKKNPTDIWINKFISKLELKIKK